MTKKKADHELANEMLEFAKMAAEAVVGLVDNYRNGDRRVAKTAIRNKAQHAVGMYKMALALHPDQGRLGTDALTNSTWDAVELAVAAANRLK